MKRKDKFFITAIRNFVRKDNFMELYSDLEHGIITHKEYEQELKRNPDKYTISINTFENPNDLAIIIDIINEIGFDLKEFTVDEVSDMFSVDLMHSEDLTDKINKLKNKQGKTNNKYIKKK